MTTYDWYLIFNLEEFLEEDLVSRTLSVALEGLQGVQEILIVRGNEVSIVYDDQILPIGFNEANPYVRDTYAVYKDENDDVWLGIQVEDA